MTVTIVETRTQERAITGGVDTHAEVHVAAALHPLGGLLGVQEFPADPAGYPRLVEWLGGFGTVCLVGIEGTGSHGAGLARHTAAAGTCTDRPVWARQAVLRPESASWLL
jgi:transposase